MSDPQRDPQLISINASDPYERGHQRGLAISGMVHSGVDIYFALFQKLGIPLSSVRADAERAVDATRQWSNALVEEMMGTADAAGLPLWNVAALNARTEILSSAVGAKPGECSTIVSASLTPVGVQTWDWHEELSDHWHLQRVRGTRHSYVGLTEHGILGKIGINDAGVGVMLNILGHRDDRAGGVPVHLVAARVLAEAADLAEAVAMLRSAPVSTSSAITVLDPDGAAIVELSPRGAVVLEPTDGALIHTNHFLDAELGRGEKPGLYDPDSQLRYSMLAQRVAATPLPTEVTALVPYLVSRPGDLAELCCVPALGATLGDRWATLATISIDAAAHSMRVSVGSPLDAETRDGIVLVSRPARATAT